MELGKVPSYTEKGKIGRNRKQRKLTGLQLETWKEKGKEKKQARKRRRRRVSVDRRKAASAGYSAGVPYLIRAAWDVKRGGGGISSQKNSKNQKLDKSKEQGPNPWASNLYPAWRRHKGGPSCCPANFVVSRILGVSSSRVLTRQTGTQKWRPFEKKDWEVSQGIGTILTGIPSNLWCRRWRPTGGSCGCGHVQIPLLTHVLLFVCWFKVEMFNRQKLRQDPLRLF